jgi:hypothetical protein
MFLEPLIPSLWHRSPGPVKWLLSRVAYFICAQFDSITHKPTTFTRQTAGDAIALSGKVDIRALLKEHDLPPELDSLAADYPLDDWQDILALADLTSGSLERELKANPQLEHLRRAAR